MPAVITRISPNPVEPEHVIWGLSRAALLLALTFVPVMVLSPGMYFWVDLLTVIPIMLMGGMCSEDMMVRMIATATNLAIIVTALGAARGLSRRLRFAFDRSKFGTRSAFWQPPGPTIWQARLEDVQLRRQANRADRARLFAHPLDSAPRTA
jgi:hypothetical protein